MIQEKGQFDLGPKLEETCSRDLRSAIAWQDEILSKINRHSNRAIDAMAVAVQADKVTTRAYTPKLRQDELYFGPVEIGAHQHFVEVRVAFGLKVQGRLQATQRMLSLSTHHRSKGTSISLGWQVEKIAIHSSVIFKSVWYSCTTSISLKGSLVERCFPVDAGMNGQGYFLVEPSDVARLLFNYGPEGLKNAATPYSANLWTYEPAAVSEQKPFQHRVVRKSSVFESTPVYIADPETLTEMAMAQEAQEKATQATLREDRVSYRLVRRDRDD